MFQVDILYSAECVFVWRESIVQFRGCCPVSKIRETGHRMVCFGFLFQVPTENISRGGPSCKDRNMLLLSGGSRKQQHIVYGNQNCMKE